ncbi:protein kinase C-binding protein 1 [Drosophila mojavensis]|uniref:protein kinase C-binding protein 1 n=1 Tax=Drosophila mojavensis TaxID=7230 RepID=UPI00017C7FAB|nr:protein kinase C-binding protein 1 [Drosophila mojavensis]
MDSSDDDDSTKSIPRPIYEATSAIDSPPPTLWAGTTAQERDALPNKRLKYVVSSPPDSANGSSSSNSSAWKETTAAAGGHASLTMKLTKVAPHQGETKPTSTSTPKQEVKVRVPKEMVALQRSHNESKVLTGYVSDSAKIKRRKSRAIAEHLIKQSSTGGSSLSSTLPSSRSSTRVRGKTLKRSKSIPAPMWDSLEEWQQATQLPKNQTKKRRNYSMACDPGEDTLADLSANEETEEESNSSHRSRIRSRSKTVSLSSGHMRSELHRIGPLEQVEAEAEAEADTDGGEWRTSSTADTDPNISIFSDATDDTKITGSVGGGSGDAREELQKRLDEIWQPPPRNNWDPFCWKCRGCGSLMPCSKCLRSFHAYCVRPASTKFDSSWKCPECLLIDSAPKRPRRNDVSVDLLSQLLAYALERMKLVRGVHKLRAPQDVLPDSYSKYFANPVSFETLAERIKNHAFHSADEFLSEVKWIQHNALILDYGDVKVEQASKAVVKVCRQEANEIDTCAECYLNANSSDEWFVKVCTQPHLLLWAKLKGFPYWPAKAMGCGPNAGVNVRFFGKHDRANVPVKDCFLYSAQDPNTQTSRRSARDLAECIREVEVHIEHIKNKIGAFNYAPYRLPYDPQEEQQQLEKMMPGVNDVINRQLAPANKTPLQFLIRKTAGDKLSIVKKTKATESGNESDQSGSPIKKPIHDAESSSPPSTSDHPKPKSSNYEVIPRAGDALRESRGCTVVLKRKSLESCKTLAKVSSTVTGEQVPIIKRKHSQSDASSETSHHGSSSEQRRRAKHARKAPADECQDDDEEGEGEQEPTEGEAEQLKVDNETSAPTITGSTEANQGVESVVELVRRRQGVTITKIPRDQQQQQQQQIQQQQQQQQPQQQQPQQKQPQPQPIPTKPNEPAAVNETIARQRAVERQQQQLISKVVPFVEIKKEVLSEPEENEEENGRPSATATQPMPVEEEQQQVPIAQSAPEISPPTAAPPAQPEVPRAAEAIEPVKIKEEVLSEEEMETDHNEPAKPSTLPNREAQPTAINSVEATPPQNVVAAAPETFVRFVGDTTIQRLSQKQAPKVPEATATTATTMTAAQTAKRGSLRGVPHGPLPAAAQSPASTPPPAPASPALSVASMSSNIQRPVPQSSPKLQQAVGQPLRVKTDKSLNETAPQSVLALPAATPTSSLLKSNMVVIPMEPRSTNGAGGSSIGSNSSSACNLNNASLMSIPVPPLRAVSKNTLQSTNVMTSITAVPVPAPAPTFPNSSLPPPPLAGLTTATTATIRPVGSGSESGGLLASALNGLPSDTLVSESIPAEPITPGLATALSELLLRPGPPKLTMRPCGPLQSDGSNLYPAQAGPLSTKLKENAHKITDYFISVIEDTLSDLAGGEPSVLQAKIAGLTLENERMKQHYERQIADLQRSTEMMISEMRKTMEQENKRVINELRQHSTLERMRAVEEAKKKQWCANCMREAQLYCCWNTSYCDYPCQQMHWQRHSATCGQASTVQAQAQTQPQVQVQSSVQVQVQAQPEITGRGKHKQMASTTPASSQQLNRTSVVGPPNKKWTHQPMISLVNPVPPASTEMLKLPNNTFLRPVSLPSTMPAPNSSTIVTPVTLITPATTSHLGNTIMTTQRNSQLNYAAKQTQPQPLPVQRYNIPLPITVSSNAQFGHITEQHQKHVAKSTSRGSLKGNSRARNANNPINNMNNMNNNNSNNNNNAQAMRHNQINHGFQQ